MFSPRLAVLGLALLLAAPSAAAWTFAPSPATTEPGRAWLRLAAGQTGPGEVAGAALGAAACALGDANADGVGDVVVQVKDAASGHLRLSALAGPDFHKTLWTQVSSANRVLACAPPLGAAQVASPVLQTLGQATQGGAGAVASESAQQVFQVLDGATGQALVGRAHLAQAQGAASAGVAVASTATAALLPAAAGAEAFLQTTAKQATAVPALPLPGLPLDALGAQAAATAKLELLDAAGRAVGSVDLGAMGETPLAIAPVPLTGALPNVAALTAQAASPVEQVAGSAPQLALYAADGTLQWSTSLAASAGTSMLVPRAGDLNLDGVPDLLVETVQGGAQAVPSAGFQLVSGLDGKVLLAPAAVDGMLLALPLGNLPAGPALLQVEQAAGAATTMLSALDASGQVKWSAQLDASAAPINAVLDAYTGDLAGFTDLTGDGVPDVGVAVKEGSGLALKALDGATGHVAWTASLAAPADLVPVALATAHGQIAQVAGAASLAANASTAALVAVGTTAPTVTLLDAASGQVLWAAHAALPADAKADLSVQAGGDLNADGVQDLLVTVTDQASQATGQAGAAASSVVALSGATGKTLFSTTTDAAKVAAAVNFTAEAGPAFHALSALAAQETTKSAPMPVAGLEAAVLLAVALLHRRRA